jgi:predicted dehydrogenase
MVGRRDFIKGAAIGAVSAGPLFKLSPLASSPNEVINVAVVGIRSRGQSHYKQLSRLPNVRVTTLCDVDERLFPEALNFLKNTGYKVKTEVDFRRILDDKSIHAVALATPDHWHALHTIWACQAGKDVYVEKPSSHNIWEGRKMIEAARKYNRVVQVGLQTRSRPEIQAAMKFLHEGGIGDIYLARGLCYKSRNTIGKKPNTQPPPGVHYDLWLGPAQQRPFNENRFHYNWHWFWEYGAADIGNQGPHQMDVARWGLNKSEYPQTVRCVGGHYAFDDDQETPNFQTAVMEYKDGKTLQFEVRGLYTNDEAGVKIGNFFYGTKGWMQIDRNGWKVFFGRNGEPGPKMDIKGESQDPNDLRGTGDEAHFVNFINAVRSRDQKILTSDIDEGHKSTALCHLANISGRVRRELRIDDRNEKFLDDKEANALLRREYRKPFVVPEKV